MKCEICRKGILDENDGELICDKCGASFIAKYIGMYEEDNIDRFDEGFEPKEWKEKYKEELTRYRQNNF